MKIDSLLEEIFARKMVMDEEGNLHETGITGISQLQGEFIKKIIEENKLSRGIEIGFAHGISSLFICSGLSRQSNKSHTIVDPFQSTQWKNIGVTTLKRAGIDYAEVIELPSEIALPKLLSEARSFNFGFIDGWHTLDHTLIDFFYLNRMIPVGGVIIIDDITLPGINKLMGYITQYPCYEVIGTLEISSWKRTLVNLMYAPFKLASFLLPNAFSSRIFSGNISRKNQKFNINTSTIALKKIEEDTRPYDWFKQF